MKRRFLIFIFFIVFLAFLVDIPAFPEFNVNDPKCDLKNIWTGAASEVCFGYVDIVGVNIVERNNYLIILISLSSSIPEVVEGKLYYYFLLDSDGNSNNNCQDKPFENIDTWYVLIYDGTWRIEKDRYRSWGWDIESTKATFSVLDGGRLLNITIPIAELGDNYRKLKKVSWKVITEDTVSHIGDIVPNSGLGVFDREEKHVEVTVTFPVYVPWIVIDGQKYLGEDGVAKVSITPGKHVVSVPKIINVSDNIKKVFVKWSDGVKENTRTIYIDEDGVDIDCVYDTLLRVRIISKYGKKIGEGWYKQGSTVNLGLSKKIVYLKKDSRVVFSNWDGSWGRNTFNPALPLQKVDELIDPITIKAVWTKEYYVNVSSTYGKAKGGGWYPVGNETVISVEKSIGFENGTRVIFKRWTGTLTVSKNKFKYKVTKPAVFRANWDILFEVSFTFYTPEKEIIVPEKLTIERDDGLEFTFTEFKYDWVKKGKYRISKVIYKGVDVKSDNASYVNINNPGNYSVPCRVYDLVIVVKDIFGIPSIGTQVTIIFPNNESITKQTDFGKIYLDNIPVGKYKIKVTNVLQTFEDEVYLDSDKTKDVNMYGSYTTFILIFILILLLYGGYRLIGDMFGGREPVVMECEELIEELKRLMKIRNAIIATIEYYKNLKKLVDSLPRLIDEYNRLAKDLSKIETAYVIKRDHERYGKIIWLIYDVISWAMFFIGFASALTKIIQVGIKYGLKKGVYKAVEETLEMIIGKFKDIKFLRDVAESLLKEEAEGIIKATAEYAKSSIEEHLNKVRERIEKGMTLKEIEELWKMTKAMLELLDRRIAEAVGASRINFQEVFRSLDNDLRDVNKRIRELMDEIERRKCECEKRYAKRVDDLKKELDKKLKELEEKYHRLISEKEKISKEIDKTYDEIFQLYEEIFKRQSRIREIGEEIDKLKEEKNRFAESKGQEITQLLLEKQKLEDMVKESIGLGLGKNRVEEYRRQRFRSLSLKLREAKGEERRMIEKEMADLYKIKDPIEWANNRINEIDDIIKDYYDKIKEMNSTIKNLEKEIESLRAEIDNINSKIRSLSRNKIDKLEEEWKKLTEKISKMAKTKETEMKKIYKEYEEKMKEAEEEFKKCKEKFGVFGNM